MILQKRRGLSSVVGSVFLITVLVTGMTYISTTMDTVGNFSEQLSANDLEEWNKQKEAFEITSIDITSGTLNAVIKNTGNLPVKITRLYLDEYGIMDIVQKIPVHATIGAGKTVNLTDYVSFPVDSTSAYSLKFITSRGNNEVYYVNSSNQQNLDLQLNALPNTIPDGFETTILFSVHNNSTDKNILMNLVPSIVVVPNDINTIVTQIGTVEPIIYDSLNPDETITFKWIYSIDGDTDDYAEFTTSLVNGYPGNEETSRVTVTEILLASESATSYTSQGFNPLSSSTSDLVLHQEQITNSSVVYQMDQKLADAIGESIALSTTSPEFTTNNGSSVTIDAGFWETTMVYRSDPFPDSLATSMDTNGGLVFHFEDGGGGLDGNEDNSFDCDPTLAKFANYEGGISVLDWDQYGGPHNTGSYTFDGSADFLSVDKSNCNDLQEFTGTVSGWFNADSGGSGTDYIYWAGKDNGANDERFEVHISNSGYLIFAFETGDTEVECNPASTDYRDDTWHHFVGVRDADYSCKLYIDGSLAVGNAPTAGSDADIGVDDPITIGARLADKDLRTGANFFEGSLDDIMYWHGFAMSSAQVTDLYNTNYGDHAHEITYIFTITDPDGLELSTITSDTAYPMNFSDGKRDGDFLNSFVYTTENVTSTIIGIDERLKLEMAFVDFTEALNMTLRIDDNSLSENTHVELPPVNGTFFPFNIYDNDSLLSSGVTSAGPFGTWITKDGSRAILTDTVTGLSYAAIIKSVNGTDLSAEQDSVFIADGESVDLIFYQPKTEPDDCFSPTCPGLIPAGLYDGRILMVGYNDEGNENTWKIDLGNIQVND